MKTIVDSRYRARLEFDGQQLKIAGPLGLLKLVHAKASAEGKDPRKWAPVSPAVAEEDFLLNHFLRKLTEPLSSDHDEVCHCRLVSRAKIENAVLQGCRSVSEISRTTLAGTGCGSCRPDLEKIMVRILGTSPAGTRSGG